MQMPKEAVRPETSLLCRIPLLGGGGGIIGYYTDLLGEGGLLKFFVG